MIHVGDEPRDIPDLIDETFGLGRGQGYRLATDPADQVLVPGVLGEVIHRWPVAEMGVGEQTRFLQGLEGAIYRGPVEPDSTLRPRLVVNVRGAEMFVVGPGHDLAHGTTSAGYPVTPRREGIDQVVGAYVHPNRLSVGPGSPSGVTTFRSR